MLANESKVKQNKNKTTQEYTYIFNSEKVHNGQRVDIQVKIVHNKGNVIKNGLKLGRYIIVGGSSRGFRHWGAFRFEI